MIGHFLSISKFNTDRQFITQMNTNRMITEFERLLGGCFVEKHSSQFKIARIKYGRWINTNH